MSNKLDALVDELVNPYSKRYSQRYEPSKDVKQATEAADDMGFIWTLSSRGLASVWYEKDGKQRQVRAEEATPAEAMCIAVVKAAADIRNKQLPVGAELDVRLFEVIDGIEREVIPPVPPPPESSTCDCPNPLPAGEKFCAACGRDFKEKADE